MINEKKNALRIFYLYDERKTKVLSVQELNDGNYNLYGLNGSIYSHIKNKEVTEYELIKFIRVHGLLRESELGQANIFDFLEDK